MRDAAATARRLAAGFAILLAFTTGLIVLGALVRAHEAGLACPDWPLCFGQVIPEMDLKVAFEWGHRALAGSVALGFAGLAIVTLRRPALRAEVGGWIALASVLLGVQILLGALTVWQLLAAWTVTSHLVVGNSFNACLLVLALRLREAAAPRPRPQVPAAARTWLAVATLLLVSQIVLGGLVSSNYAGLACPQWPLCSGGQWFPTWKGIVGLHLVHRWNAVLLVGAVGAAALACRRVPGLRALGALACVLIVAQFFVGIANVVLGLPVEVTGLHSALAAALVLTFAASLSVAFRAAPQEASWTRGGSGAISSRERPLVSG